MLTVLEIAKVCHEVNKAYCEALGDTSQPTWEDAPEWQKSSAMTGVHLHLNNPNAGPDDSHNSWLKQKQEEGWSYGPVKDPELKQHPCFVPYEELPASQKAKDYIFRQVVHSLRVL
jgi:cytochrome c1